MTRVLVVATSRKTRGGITSVVKAHETGEQWKRFHCRWIQTHRDGPAWRKVWYLVTALIEYMLLLPWYDIVHIHVATTQSARRKKLFFVLAKLLHKRQFCISILQMKNFSMSLLTKSYIAICSLKQILCWSCLSNGADG